MKLPYGANEDDFENIKKIVSEFTNNDKNLDESTLEINSGEMPEPKSRIFIPFDR